MLALENSIHGEIVHELDSRVTEHQTRTKHSRDKNTVRHLGGDAGSRAQGRGDDILSGERVDHAGDDDVQGNCNGVQPDDGGRVVLVRVAHLAHDRDEGLVAGVSESDVQDRFELGGHRRQRVGAKSHYEWLTGRFVKVSKCFRVWAVDSQSNDNDEDGPD